MQNQIQKLSKFGRVKTCKQVHNSVITIVVTDGFSDNANKTIEFLDVCSKCFPNHPILETCITEPNFAMVVLVSQNN